MLPTNVPPTHLQREEEAITRWLHRAPPGTKVEHVFDPDYWSHVAARLLRTPNKGIHDVIRVVAEDGSFDVEVTVMAVDPRGLWAQVRQHSPNYNSTSKEEAMPADKDGYKIELSGPHRWRIVDRNNELVAKDFPDQEAAKEALANIKLAKGRKVA